MKTYTFLMLTFLLFVSGCDTPGAEKTSADPDSRTKDHSELGLLFSDLVHTLKTENDSLLREFCLGLSADSISLDYMRKSDLCYRGIPCKVEANGVDLKTIGLEFYPNLLKVRNSLKAEGLLSGLTHIDSTTYSGKSERVKNMDIRMNTQPIALRSGDTFISLEFGELLFFEDKWSLFTLPSDRYSKSKIE